MNRFPICRIKRWMLCLVVLLAGAGVAQDEMPSTSEISDQRFQEAVEGARDLSVAALGKTIDLGTALRITLARQPSVHLAKEDLEIARAAVENAVAPFDLTLLSEVRHGRFYEPLNDREIAARQTAVQELAEANQGLAQAQAIQANADQLLNQATVLGALPALVNPATTNATAAASLVANQQTQLQRTQARLDALLTRSSATTIREGSSSYTVGMSKLTRSGVVIIPHLDWVRTEDIENTATINLDFVIPMAQGRGAITERAVEDASRVDLEASKWQLRHEVSLALFNTAVAFWNLLAAQQDYALLRDSEEISRSFTELAQLRLEQQETSVGQLAIAESRLADAVSDRIGAEFVVFNARHQLGLAMGLEGKELVDPPYARGVLPRGVPGDAMSSVNQAQVLRKAVILRDDQRAAIQLARSGKILARAARFDLKPIVNLFFEFAYTGVDTGTHFDNTFSAFTDDKTGLGAFGGVSLEWPLQLSAARANFQRNEALSRQRTIGAMDLERNIVSNTKVAIHETASTRRQISYTERAADYSRQALVAARNHYNEESSNLLAAIQLEEQYTDSLRDLIRAYFNHVVAVSGLRFETGTILDPAGEYEPQGISFRTENLSSLPNWATLPDSPIRPIPTSFDQPPLPLLKKKGSQWRRSAIEIHPLKEGWNEHPGPEEEKKRRWMDRSVESGDVKEEEPVDDVVETRSNVSPEGGGKPKPLLKKLFKGD